MLRSLPKGKAVGPDQLPAELAPNAMDVASAPEVSVATGFLPYNARRGANTWQIARQARWVGVAWDRCTSLLVNVPFFEHIPAPAPPPVPPSRIEKRAVAAFQGCWIRAWARQQVSY